nr:O-antigen ligase family protein [Gammaproteobacteria bacterium]
MQSTATTQSNYTRNVYQCAGLSLGMALFFMNISVTLCSIFYILALGLALAGGSYRHYFSEVINNPISRWMLGLFALLMICSSYSTGNWQHIRHDLLRHLWLLTTPLLIPLFYKNKTRHFLLNFLLAGMSIVMVLSYLGHWHILSAHSSIAKTLHMYRNNPSDVFQGHIVENFLMAFASGLWLYKFYYQPNRWRWLNGLLFILASSNVIFISTGRTGYIVYIALFLLLSLYRFGWRKFIYFILMLAAQFGLAIILPTGLATRVHNSEHHYQLYQHAKSPTKATSNADSQRVEMLFNDLRLIKKRPWFGYGTGGFGSAYATLPAKDMQMAGMQPWSSEFTLLNVAVEFGLIGALLFLSFFAYLVYCSFRLEEKTKIIFQGFLLIFLIGSCFTAFFSTTFVLV